MSNTMREWMSELTKEQRVAMQKAAYSHDQLAAMAVDYIEQIALLERLRLETADKLREALNALHSLTPGGSEFADDPQACVDVVRKMRSSQHEVILSFKKQRDEAQANLREVQSTIAEQDRAVAKVGLANAALQEKVCELERALEAKDDLFRDASFQLVEAEQKRDKYRSDIIDVGIKLGLIMPERVTFFAEEGVRKVEQLKADHAALREQIKEMGSRDAPPGWK